MNALLRQTSAISIITFKELIREKILWSTFVFAIALVALSFAVAQLSVYEPERIALDFGAAAIGLIGSLLSIIVGGSIIQKEMKERTLYLILTKSVWRWQFILGKIFGLFAVVFLNTMLMYGVLSLVVVGAGGAIKINYFINVLLQFCEFTVLACVSVFFSCFTTAVLAGVFTTGIWLIGHAMDDVVLAVQKISIPGLRQLFQAGIKILPDLTIFDIKTQLSHNIPVAGSYVAQCLIYAFIFSVFVTAASCLIFSKRDL